jgi:hypothetical protein|uniref:Uncharacterized protein n=1 Tax=Zea mays TaxID=4577 RepID=A0A804M027_MAIZE
MSKSPRTLQEVMAAVDARHAVDGRTDSASSDSSKLLGPRRRSTRYYGRGARKSAPPVAVAMVEASSDASFEFSAAASYSSASPASMVFSDGQLCAHQFPAVRSSASTGSSQSQATSQARSPSAGSCSTKRQQAGVTGSMKRVSFAMDGEDKAAAAVQAAGGRQGKKSGGLLGCMGSTCAPSRNQAVEPVARNPNRKMMAV